MSDSNMSAPAEDTTLQEVSISVDETKNVDDPAETLEKTGETQSAVVEMQEVCIELTSAIKQEGTTERVTQKANEGKVTYANSITLTPGTVTTQIKDNVFEVHALTKEFGDDVRSSEMDKMVTWLEKGK